MICCANPSAGTSTLQTAHRLDLRSSSQLFMPDRLFNNTFDHDFTFSSLFSRSYIVILCLHFKITLTVNHDDSWTPFPGRMQFGEENEKLKFVQVSSAAFLDLPLIILSASLTQCKFWRCLCADEWQPPVQALLCSQWMFTEILDFENTTQADSHRHLFSNVSAFSYFLRYLFEHT